MKRIKLDTVDTYNKLYGLETLHPLVTIVDLNKAKSMANHITMEYGLYALFLKNSTTCSLKYGRRAYDYQEGTIVSFSPGQIVEVEMKNEEISADVYGILFHPDLIRNTSLGHNIRNYSFFSYASSEALHLSEKERKVIMDCLDKISLELNHSIDKHSTRLITMNIELLLGYCLRFYERQFTIREFENIDIIQKFELYLDEYLNSDLPQKAGLPSVSYFADKICLSPNYFGDLIKKETGKTAQEYIQFKMVEKAKDRILGSNLTMSEIAYELGFKYPQHFGRLFKREVGLTPKDYRSQN